MKDLTTQDGRMFEINKIENDFIQELRFSLFEISPDAICRINHNSIQLGIKDDKGQMAFASDITLYPKNNSTFGRDENEINSGSSGSFNPTIKESYFRTIHAASILKNWDLAFKIIIHYCNAYRTLEKIIFELQKTKQ